MVVGEGHRVRLGLVEEGPGNPTPECLGHFPPGSHSCLLPLRDRAPTMCQASLVSMNLRLTQE